MWWLLPWLSLRQLGRIIPRSKSGLDQKLPCSPPDHKGTSRSWFGAILLYLSFWAIYGVVILLIGRAVVSFPAEGWLEATFSISLSWIAGFVALFVPAGIGIREFALANLLSRSTGILLWQSTWIAIIARLLAIFTELIWVVIGLFLYAAERWNLRQRGDRITRPPE